MFRSYRHITARRCYGYGVLGRCPALTEAHGAGSGAPGRIRRSLSAYQDGGYLQTSQAPDFRSEKAGCKCCARRQARSTCKAAKAYSAQKCEQCAAELAVH
eukprot:6191718-Pleurochrysis_carterae.AAC.3